MPTKIPRRPIAIIGAGIAGLSAAEYLQSHGFPIIVLEKFKRAGGRFNSRKSNGWIADHGCRYIRRDDLRLGELIRKAGLEQRRTTIQGGIHRLRANGVIERQPNGGIDLNRCTLDYGFSILIDELASQLPVKYNHSVGAIRWDNSDKTFWWEEGQVFWFEDENGDPVRDPTSKEVLTASAVILATTPTAGRRIAEKSPALKDLAPILSTPEYSAAYTGIYRIARMKPGFFALEGEKGARIQWAAFENAKAPERVEYQYSLLLAQAGDEWSRELISLPEGDAMAALFNELRQLIPELPEKPISETYKIWNVSQLQSAPLGLPNERGFTDGRWPARPAHAPFALAGDYVSGPRAEDAAQSGVIAAKQIINQLPARKTFLGLELKQ